MTLKTFFTGRTLIFVLLVIVGGGIFAYQAYLSRIEPSKAVTPVENESEEPPVFTWKFEEASTLNLDGLPETRIFLQAQYSNEEIINKLIATVPGSCNELPDADKDSVPGSATVQCYAAGIGDLFKITKGEKSYRVEHKIFEEASPDYNPPSQEYEVITEFPL